MFVQTFVMESGSKKFRTVEEYLSAVPTPAKKILQELRATIRQAAPGAQEVISYNMPAIKQYRVLVYYAAYKGHIGFYPTPSPIKIFSDELKGYKTSKGAIQFPIHKPIPIALVKKIVKLRVHEDNERAMATAKKKK